MSCTDPLDDYYRRDDDKIFAPKAKGYAPNEIPGSIPDGTLIIRHEGKFYVIGQTEEITLHNGFVLHVKLVTLATNPVVTLEY